MRAALWARVSANDQETANQLRELRLWADRLGYEIVTEYVLDGASAWKGAHQPELERALLAAHKREFDVLLVWAADRLTREGIEALLRAVRRFKEAGIRIRSLQEPWFDSDGATGDLLLAIAGWLAEQESARRSERIKAGLARVVANGGRAGRKPGAKDVRQRKRRTDNTRRKAA